VIVKQKKRKESSNHYSYGMEKVVWACSGVVEEVVGIGVVEEVVGCGVVEDVVGCGVVEEVVGAVQVVQQSSELVDPDDTVYLPDTQIVQTVEADATEYVPSKQVAHELDPAMFEYLPGGHE
jgi:hypothetical protein